MSTGCNTFVDVSFVSVAPLVMDSPALLARSQVFEGVFEGQRADQGVGLVVAEGAAAGVNATRFDADGTVK